VKRSLTPSLMASSRQGRSIRAVKNRKPLPAAVVGRHRRAGHPPSMPEGRGRWSKPPRRPERRPINPGAIRRSVRRPRHKAAGRPQTTKAVSATAAGSISADYANYRAHSARPARSPAVRETRRRRGWAAGASRYPLHDRRRPGGDWSDPPPTHAPLCRPVFFEFLDRRHQPHQKLEMGQGFKFRANRKPMLMYRSSEVYPTR
jgi:hypothetical protein